MPEFSVPIEHLRVGVFIRLDLKWYEHPFLLNHFKIKSDGQIQALKDLGLSQVTYDPLKSDRQPAPPIRKADRPEPVPARTPAQPSSNDRLWEMKKQRIKQLQERNLRIQKCEKQYHRTFSKVKNIMRDLAAGSDEASEQAGVLIHEMVESLLSEREVVVHLMNVKGQDEGIYFHTLNVAILALLLGKEYGVKADSMERLGLGALFHDIGKHRVPKKILQKRAPLTPPERQLLHLHPKYGEEMASRMKDFPKESALIIRQHHEANDGTGFPDGLQSDKISVLAKIMSVANVYDNYCNHWNPEDCMTPHEAMSHMFCLLKSKFDTELLSLFIHSMGIYPPGTVVQLSNDLVGIVVTLSPDNRLRPCILVYDEKIPRKEALLLDLSEDPEISIVNSIRPSQLPAEVYSYLNPRSQVTYFFDTYEKSPISPLMSSS